jgi:hypothetical protein
MIENQFFGDGVTTFMPTRKFSEFLEINSPIKWKSASECSPPWLHQEIENKTLVLTPHKPQEHLIPSYNLNPLSKSLTQIFSS